MPKITLIGAGSAVFTRNLCSDILLASALQGCTISLMDIDAGRLRNSHDLVQNIVDQRGLDTRLDPLTAAVRTLPEIRSLVDEMLVAQAHWLPQVTGIET